MRSGALGVGLTSVILALVLVESSSAHKGKFARWTGLPVPDHEETVCSRDALGEHCPCWIKANHSTRCLPVKSCLAEEGNGNFCGDPVSTGLRVPTASPSLLIAENAHQVTFDTLARSKDVFNAGATSHVWGRLLKSDGTAVLEHDAATGQNIIPSVDDVSQNPGFFSIFVNPADDKIYGLQHFEGDAHTVTTASGVAQEAESAKGRLGAVYLAELTAKAGQLEMVRAEPVNFNTAANKNAGVWNPSGGSVTPWSSHLGSEESEPDARKWAGRQGFYKKELSIKCKRAFEVDAESASFLRFYGLNISPNDVTGEMERKTCEDGSCFTPYKYGWAWEAKIHIGSGSSSTLDDYRGHAEVNKHYAMGRLSYKESHVMPDQRTVYNADTAAHGGAFTKFVATTPKDLSKGELFCAKLIQLTPDGATAQNSKFNIEWKSMGVADDATIRSAIGTEYPFPDATNVDNIQHICHKTGVKADPLLTFDDIFDSTDVHASVPVENGNEAIANDVGHNSGKCPAGYTSIRTASNTQQYECLRVRIGMEMHASRLETRRYAAMLGCTTELSQSGGMTYSSMHQKLFVTFSTVEGKNGGMEKNTDVNIGGTDHIKVAPNKCGCIFSMTVVDNSASTMEGWLCGTPLQSPDKDFDHNMCELNGVSNPENVAMMEDLNQLLISDRQDGMRRNNAVFVHDFDSKSLTRIFTSPEGGETTNPAYWPEIHGNTYISMVVQHPLAQYTDGSSDWTYPTAAARQIDNAYTGYLYFNRTKASLESPLWRGITAPKSAEKHHLRFSRAATFGAKEVAVDYNLFARTGDSFPAHADVWGTHMIGGLIDKKGDSLNKVSNAPGFMSLHEIDEDNEKKIYSIMQFGSVNDIGVMYLSEMMQDSSVAGFSKLSIKNTAPIDVSRISGLFQPSSGSLSPWKTHLGIEGSIPTIPVEINSYTREVLQSDRYGYVFEVRVFGNPAKATVVKHYSMGRRHGGGLHVMPDKKTVYLTDSRATGLLTKYVAEHEGDLSYGELFCAKITDDVITWISFGAKVSDNQVEIQLGVDADIIKNLIDPGAIGCSNMPAGGVTFSPSHNTLFIAMPLQSTCGCVMGMQVDSAYSAHKVVTTVCGRSIVKDDQDNTCDSNSLARPMNVQMLEDYNQLIITEDSSSNRANNNVWIYEFNSMALTRILSSPLSAKIAAPSWQTFRGYHYLTLSFQDPYHGFANEQYHERYEPESTGSAGWIGALRYVVDTTSGWDTTAPSRMRNVWQGLLPPATFAERHSARVSGGIFDGNDVATVTCDVLFRSGSQLGSVVMGRGVQHDMTPVYTLNDNADTFLPVGTCKTRKDTSTAPTGTAGKWGFGRVELGSRPDFLVQNMDTYPKDEDTTSGRCLYGACSKPHVSPLHSELNKCLAADPLTENKDYKFLNVVPRDFSMSARGAALEFPEHTVEAYRAAAQQGAGVIGCEIAVTKDGHLVCRSSQCDLHHSTNILETDLKDKCKTPFVAAAGNSATGNVAAASGKVVVECCTTDLTLHEFKTLCGKMSGGNTYATSEASYMQGTKSFRTDLYATCGTLLTHAESIAQHNMYGRKFMPELKAYAVSNGSPALNVVRAKVVQEYIDAGIDASRVWLQSAVQADGEYWIDNSPRFGLQVTIRDNSARALDSLAPLKARGFNFINVDWKNLVDVNSAKDAFVESNYAKAVTAAGLKIFARTLEETQPTFGQRVADLDGIYTTASVRASAPVGTNNAEVFDDASCAYCSKGGQQYVKTISTKSGDQRRCDKTLSTSISQEAYPEPAGYERTDWTGTATQSSRSILFTGTVQATSVSNLDPRCEDTSDSEGTNLIEVGFYDPRTNRGVKYGQAGTKIFKSDGDTRLKYELLHVLAKTVKITGMISDWPATVTFYSNCMTNKVTSKKSALDLSAGWRADIAASAVDTLETVPIRTELGSRPDFLVHDMDPSVLKDRLTSCLMDEELEIEVSDLASGYQGASLQFPEHTKESYRAALQQGAGMAECEIVGTKDKVPVCRKEQCDLHLTTNILDTKFEKECRVRFTPYDGTNDAAAKCCAADLNWAQLSQLCARVRSNGVNTKATTVEDFVGSIADTANYGGAFDGSASSGMDALVVAAANNRCGAQSGGSSTTVGSSSSTLIPGCTAYKGNRMCMSNARDCGRSYIRTQAYGAQCAKIMQHSEYIKLVQDFAKRSDGYKHKFVSTLVPTDGNTAVNNLIDTIEANVISEYAANTDIVASRIFIKSPTALVGTGYTPVRTFDEEDCNGLLSDCGPTVAIMEGLTAGSYVGVPQQQLIAVRNNKYEPSELALLAKKKGLKITTWGFERPESLPMSTANSDRPFYSTSTSITNNDGDAYEMLHVLASEVGIEHISTSWPATVTFYANCMANCKSTMEQVSDSPDFTSIQEHDDGKIYSLTHFDNTPGAIYLSELVSKGGQLETVKAQPVDVSNVHGIWKPAAGSVTPWGTHIGGESSEPDARFFIVAREHTAESGHIQAAHFSRYFGTHGYLKDKATTKEIKAAGFNPYHYGFTWEAVVSGGKASISKHYAMGRLSSDAAYVMPDRKTVYTSDGGSDNRILTKFVADMADDLSTGELFCAKLTQLTKDGGAAHDSKFSVEWLSMGSADDTSLSRQLAAMPTLAFDDIYDSMEPNSDWSETSACDVGSGYKSVRTSSGHECLKVKAGMDLFASRFETRRDAAMLGCTSELNLLQGITLSASKDKLYLAVAAIEGGMTDDYSLTGNDRGGHNHIKLSPNPCGCVLELDLDHLTLEPLLCGMPKMPGGTTCHADAPRHPRNVAMMEELDQLLISENADETGQGNAAMWVYDFYTKSLTRVFTAPAGASATSPYWHKHVTGTRTEARKGNYYISIVSKSPINQAAIVSTITLDNKVQPDYSPVWAAIDVPGAMDDTSPRAPPAGDIAQHQAHSAYMLAYAACPDAPGTPAPNRLPIFAGNAPRCLKKFGLQTLMDPLQRTGTSVTNYKIGRILDNKLNVVYKQDKNGAKTADEDISTSPDFTSLLNKDGKIYSITQFASKATDGSSGSLGALYLSEVTQDLEGKLEVIRTAAFDTSQISGIASVGGGLTTSWGSHLGTEVLVVDAKVLDKDADADKKLNDDIFNAVDGPVLRFIRYFGKYFNGGDVTARETRDIYGFHPYRYGYVFEARLIGDSKVRTGDLKRHYAMGRRMGDSVTMMPDGKTVYMTDASGKGALSKFVASTAGDLSSGELFCAKMTSDQPPYTTIAQQPTRNHGNVAYNSPTDTSKDDEDGSYSVEWISMGHADDSELEAAVATTKFQDLFEDEGSAGGLSGAADKCRKVEGKYADGSNAYGSRREARDGYVHIWADSSADGECLKLKADKEKLASRFETQRYAAYLGCTTELSNNKGLTLSPSNNQLYTAISNVIVNTPATAGRTNRPDDLQLKTNACGCIYVLDLDEDYSATSFKPLVCGKPQTRDDKDYQCNSDGLSSPGSVAMIEDYQQLLIGQASASTKPATGVGSDNDINDVVWVYDFTTRALTRLLSAPWGAATASPSWHKGIKAANLPDSHPGFNYITASLAHPYGLNALHPKLAATANSGKQGYITYLGPLPNFDKMPPKIPEPPAPVVDTHILRFGIAVEIGEAAMDADKQHVVRRAIASATEMHISKIVIEKISAVKLGYRRLLMERSRLDVGVLTTSVDLAEHLANITETQLNFFFFREGLGRALIITDPTIYPLTEKDATLQKDGPARGYAAGSSLSASPGTFVITLVVSVIVGCQW